MARDTVGQTFLVAAILCVSCSVVVSTAAVTLRNRQEANKRLDRSKNVLSAAGLIGDDALLGPTPTREAITRAYEERVTTVLIDLATGEECTGVDEETYDPREAARNESLSEPVVPAAALMGVRARAKCEFVYLVKEGERVDSYVLPIHGNGLWSTLWGFLALEGDARTIRGITFYEQGETPGLGGEVENPSWKAQWNGKLAYDDQGEVDIRVIKGQVSEGSPDAAHQVDGLSGATITSRGVSQMVQYWLGEEGFGPYLESVRSGAPPTTDLGNRNGDP